MPVVVKTEHLQPGWFFGEDICNRIGVPLITRGSEITRKKIIALAKRGITQIRVCLSAQELDENVNNRQISNTEIQKAKEQIRTVLREAAGQRALREETLQNLRKSLCPIIDSVFQSGTSLFNDIRLMASHDEYTYEHSWMVMVTSLALAKAAWEEGKITLDYQDQVNICIGSTLHDIGKIVIPLSTLRKPGRLDDDEWKAIKLHPQCGFDMVRDNVNIMPLARAIILHHHQRWDGNGYGSVHSDPLREERIPSLVRLTSIADSYDAIVSDRPYHRGVLPFYALKIIEDNAGTQFDPTFAPLLKKVVTEYPAGSILLLKGGIITVVSKPPDEDNHITCKIISSLTKENAPYVGRKMDIASNRSSIVDGAPSLEILLEHLRKRQVPAPVKVLKEWEKLFRSASSSQ